MYSGVAHGNSTYVEHCVGVYNILSDMGCSDDVCNAGLYHSVYGTESFNTNVVLTKDDIVKSIGVRAEYLVAIFCHIANRTQTIINNPMGFDKKTHYDLLCIEYANLREQYNRYQNNDLGYMLAQVQDALIQNKNTTTPHRINGKDVFIFDDLLTNSDIEWINSFCVNSKYTPEHRSNQLNYETDCRFSCSLSDEDLSNTKLFPALRSIVDRTKLKLGVRNAYINHYTISTSTSKHCDSSDDNTFTVLVFCNKYWEQTWGGEIVFYDDKSDLHTMVEYKPARILVFDSRISHKVLPLTFSARKDRYTIAIKCFIEKETP